MVSLQGIYVGSGPLLDGDLQTESKVVGLGGYEPLEKYLSRLLLAEEAWEAFESFE